LKKYRIEAPCEAGTNDELEDRAILCHLFYPLGKPEDSRSDVAKGLQQPYYGGTLGALALKPSGFCNNGVNPTVA
jgi:hypothetical protein